MYEVRYFTMNEFRCPCCKEVAVAAELVLLLDVSRAFAGVPFRLSSGFRCVHHNREVGGVDNSRHLIGCAADILCPEKLTMARFTEIMATQFRRPGYEFKPYINRNFVHVAIPRQLCDTEFWDGGLIRTCS